MKSVELSTQDDSAGPERVEEGKGTAIELNDVAAEENYDITEHQLPLDELAKLLDVDFSKGLTEDEAERRLERDGPNMLTPPPRTPWWVKFAEHLFGGFALLLWAGSILCFIVYGINGDVENLTLGIVLAVVVVITGIFSFYQEFKSDAIMAGFMSLASAECDVMRDGNFRRVNANHLVCGDIVKIEKGFKVAADMIVLESNGIKVDNSSLTGESEPQKRSPKCTDELARQSRNVAFFSTDCTDGVGKGVVVRTGDRTSIGCIASMTTLGEKPDTLMKQEIKRFVMIISCIALCIGLVFFIISLAIGYNVLTSAIFTIGIIVANVPEGLLATVTVALAITAQRMHSKNVLVKTTETVETLGSINAIASDKTGTLTQNRMTVRHAIFNSSRVTKLPDGRENSSVAVHSRLSEENIMMQSSNNIELNKRLTSDDSEPTREPGTGNNGSTGDEKKESWAIGMHPVNRATGRVRRANEDLVSLIRAAGLCNHSVFEEGENEKPILQRKTTSDPTEGALLKFAHSHTSVYELRRRYPEVACVPFSSVTKWMATIHEERVGHRLIIKGAPEKVLERCSFHGAGEPITPEILSDIEDANAEVAENGERVLAFAELLLPDIPHGFEFQTDEGDGFNFPCDGLRFVGMASIEDPPRDEVPPAVACCHEAGIQVIMVTGDHALTARSIAGQVGILQPAADGELAPLYNMALPLSERCDNSKNCVVVTGPDVKKFTDDDWEYVLGRRDIVFARTQPDQKQQIVARLQSHDLVVAVTGDGVNDAPALKKADVGIAMGTGSQVAQDAADMILMDDNFASIVKGIEEGRLIFANLKKSIAYTLTSNIPEITPFLCHIALKLPLSLTTIMILCIDLGTDMLPAISFAYETSEQDIMKQPPRDRSVDKLVTWQLISFSYLQIGMIQAIAAFAAFFFVFDRVGNFSSSSLLNGKYGATWTDNEDDDDNNLKCSIKNDNDECVYFDERMDILEQAQTAFLASIVIMQIGCGIACKTRINSIFNHGMLNWVLNFGIFQEICLIALLVYAPFLNYAFGTRGLDAIDWVIAIPFAVAVVIYDENRKYWFRKLGKNSWFYKNFYY